MSESLIWGIALSISILLIAYDLVKDIKNLQKRVQKLEDEQNRYKRENEH